MDSSMKLLPLSQTIEAIDQVKEFAKCFEKLDMTDAREKEDHRLLKRRGALGDIFRGISEQLVRDIQALGTKNREPQDHSES